jgi:antitoxin Phd
MGFTAFCNMDLFLDNLGLNLTVNLGIIKARGADNMTNIVPISDLKNYTEVLSHCDNGSTVYLTKNGRGKYVVQSLVEYEKLQVAVKLLAELSKGVESIRTEGVLSIDEAFAGLED